MRRWRGALVGSRGARHAVDGATVVGRGERADVSFDDPSIARQHALIVPTADGAVVGDLDTTNGTLVDDERVTEPRLIRPGATLRIGRTRLRWEPGDDHEVEPIAPDLAAELAAGGVDPTPWLVHADWLTARGHLRGELIVVQHRIELARSPELELRAAELRAALRDPRLEVRDEIWRFGYRRAATVIDVVAIARVLCDPSSAFLQKLTVAAWHPDYPRRHRARAWLDALAPRLGPPRLRASVVEET